MLLVVIVPVGGKTSRSSWHATKRPWQLGFGVVCTWAPADPGPHARGVLRPGGFLLSPGGVCWRPGPGMGMSLRCDICTEQGQPDGARPGDRGALAVLALSQARTGSALPGAVTKGCGDRDTAVPRSSHRCCRAQLASCRALPGARGCRLGRITPLRCQISQTQGLCSGSPWDAR